MNRPINSTAIDDLPDIDDFDNNVMGNILPRNAPNITKFMKHNHHPPSQSGMIQKGHNYNSMGGYSNNNHQIYDPEMAQIISQQNKMPTYGEMIDDNNNDNVNCREVCAHIRNCEVCSQIYKSDKSLYILAIVILSIICVLLLKKVMDL